MINWGLISLTTPIMLSGLAFLTLPILAHVLNRRSRKRVVFPSIKLLQQSVANQSHLFRLRRWILLALRCLIVALIVLAFARPLWYDRAAGSGPKGGQKAVVILLDASASTTQTRDGVSAFHLQRAVADRHLDTLVSGSGFANLIPMTGRPQLAMPRLTQNLPALREELRRLTVSLERADLLRSIALAGDALRNFAGEKRVVILSDLQRSNWDDVLKTRDISKLLPAGTQIEIPSTTESPIENTALSDPRYFPSQPLAKQPLQFSVRITNYSKTSRQSRVTLKIDGQNSGEQTVILTANEQREVAFPSVTLSTGEHLVEISNPEDALICDDRAFLVVNTIERLPVLIISDDDATEVGSASYFLNRALAPHGDENDRFQVRQVTVNQLSAQDLASTTAVFMGYLSELTPAAANLLKTHLEQGGGFMLFCGEGAVARHLQVLDSVGGEAGLLPWEPGSPRDTEQSQEALRITAGKWQSRLLTDFDEQSQLSMSQIRFQRTWTVGTIRPTAQILLTFSDGAPALGQRQVGPGQILLANFSPSLQTSDLAKYGSFVALMQSFAKQMRPASTTLKSPVVGESYRVVLPLPVPFHRDLIKVTGPDRKSVAVRTSVDTGRLLIELDRIETPGIYEFHHGKTQLAAAAFHIDPRESDPQALTPSGIVSHFQNIPSATTPPLGTTTGTLSGAEGHPFWGSCVGAAMCLIGLELLLIGIWRR